MAADKTMVARGADLTAKEIVASVVMALPPEGKLVSIRLMIPMEEALAWLAVDLRLVAPTPLTYGSGDHFYQTGTAVD